MDGFKIEEIKITNMRISVYIIHTRIAIIRFKVSNLMKTEN